MFIIFLYYFKILNASKFEIAEYLINRSFLEFINCNEDNYPYIFKYLITIFSI